MAQKQLGDIDPNTTSGTQLAALLTAWGQAVETTNIGPGRPPGIIPGQLYVDSSDPNTWVLKMATPLGDARLLTVNVTVGDATFNGRLGTVLQGSVPPTRRIVAAGASLAGGGDLTQDRYVNLVGDFPIGRLPGGYYYGTTAGQATDDRGFHPLPGAASLAPRPVKRRLGVFGPGDHVYNVPGDVTGIFVWMYAGGGDQYQGGRGGSASGCLDVAPGGSIHVIVGGPGGATVLADAIVCAPGAGGFNGGTSVPNGFNFVDYAPRLTPTDWGGPGQNGLVWLEAISP